MHATDSLHLGEVDSSATMTLGPVIGWVTPTSARILIETDGAATATCFVRNPSGAGRALRLATQPHKPTVFSFESLEPNTRYCVNISEFAHPPSAFTTLDGGNDLSVAFVSEPDGTAADTGAWLQLCRRARNDELALLVHLGSTTAGNASVAKTFESALALVPDSAVGNWQAMVDLREAVTEVFREAYRSSWRRPTVRLVLANVSNLMLNPNACFVRSLGDPTHLTAKQRCVLECMQEAYAEYHHALLSLAPGEPQPLGPRVMAKAVSDRAAWKFGEYGIVVLDSFRLATLKKGHSQRDAGLEPAFRSELQMALQADGTLSNCDTLVCCSQTPLFPVCNQHNKSWNLQKQKELFELLEEWTASTPKKRSVLFAGGHAYSTTIANISRAGMVVHILAVGPVSGAVLKGPSTQKNLPGGWTRDTYSVFPALSSFGLLLPGTSSPEGMDLVGKLRTITLDNGECRAALKSGSRIHACLRWTPLFVCLVLPVLCAWVFMLSVTE
eukprot:TRINITY_DN6665_c0_g1_i1.p1 TRINITY_DN6665_c0_g1~~TRINITY_DN6665_c0_g1_i1.p1  ORF type:complete len:512 (+),score=64.28 TRINITY_DN6665_c0_g1_i1:39-1538(+)